MSEDNDYLSRDEIKGLIGSCNTPDGFYQEKLGFRAICTVDDPGEKLPLTYKVGGGSVESKHYTEKDKAQERAEVMFEAESAEALQEVFDSFVERADPDDDFELVKNNSN